MFNYFSYEKQKTAHEKGIGGVLHDLVRKKCQKQASKKYLKSFNNRIESFMLNMISEPVVMKKPVKRWTDSLRDPNENESSE